ncbi:hypothetical protein BH11ACT3_BH11ACT3_10110 [soil metagenome]
MTPRAPERAAALTVLALLVVTAVSGCVAPPTIGPGAAHENGSTASGPDLSLPTTETVTITDPVADSFTVDVPEGWSSVAYAAGQFDVHREIVQSISPDGNTILFLGDPKIPNYWNPATANPTIVEYCDLLEYMELQPYTQAEDYFTVWADSKFGRLPGYEFIDWESDPSIVQSIQDAYTQAGYQAPRADAVRVKFDYDAEDGVRMHGLIVGLTLDSGTFWNADVNGMVTDRDLDDYEPMLNAMSNSKKTKQSYIAAQQANNAAINQQIADFSDQLTAQHNANMAAIQASAQAHQQHMAAIEASNDASVQAWNEQMAASDYNQQGFLNYINEENTVAGSSGQTYQVTNGYQTYYVNPSTGEYVGGDVNFGDQQLLALGLNPSDYELTQILH